MIADLVNDSHAAGMVAGGPVAYLLISAGSHAVANRIPAFIARARQRRSPAPAYDYLPAPTRGNAHA